MNFFCSGKHSRNLMHTMTGLHLCVCACACVCLSQAEIMTMMTVVGPTGARGTEWWRMTQAWALMVHRQWVMTAHPSQSSTLHYLYGENSGTKAGRAALLLPSNDICSRRQPRYRSSFTSLSLHLSPSMEIFLLFFLPFPLLTLCHPLCGGYAEVRQWDNDSNLSTFQIRALSFSLPSAFILNPSPIDPLIFACSHASDITEEKAALVMLETGCEFKPREELAELFQARWYLAFW